MKQLIHGADKVVNWVIVLTMLFLLLLGGYALWDTAVVYHAAQVPNDVLDLKPTGSNPSFAELQAINPDVCAWLTIDDTHIDYPVVQGIDNSEYLSCDVYGNYFLGGSVFLDYRNQRNFSDFYSLLYGHHMDGGAMFGDVKEFEDQAFFDAHQTGTLVTEEKTYALEILACLHADAYDPYLFSVPCETEADKAQLLQYILDSAICSRESDVSTDDQLLAMSTCSSATTNGRTILVAKLVS